MPSKRYLIAVMIIVSWSIWRIWRTISWHLFPSEWALLIQDHIQPKVSAVDFAFLALYVGIVAYFTKRIYLLAAKEKQLLVPGKYGTLVGIQKLGSFLLNTGYFVLVISCLGLVVSMIFISSGGMSGVPFGIGVILSLFLFFLSVFALEIGNISNRKSNTKINRTENSSGFNP